MKKSINVIIFISIENKLNGKYYYGIHSTNKLDDGYMGSGKRLHYAYEKYGIEHFSKEILKFFNSRKEVSDYEEEMIKEEMIKSDECYNIRYGGDNGGLQGFIPVRDNDGNTFSVLPDDERYISGKVVPVWTGKTPFKTG